MRRPVLLVALLAFLALSSGPARAGLPGGSNSSIPSMIRLVGADPLGHPDPFGVFTVTVRDLANQPVVGSYVIVDFTAATDVALCGVQGAGTTLGPSGVSGVTDANGQVTMSLLGHAISGAPASSPFAVKIFADGLFLGSVRVAAFDLDGAGGANGADESRWLADFVSGTYATRGDYNNDGLLGGNDLSLWLAVFVLGKSAQSCPSVVTAPN